MRCSGAEIWETVMVEVSLSVHGACRTKKMGFVLDSFSC
jgi:hypothetical protein